MLKDIRSSAVFNHSDEIGSGIISFLPSQQKRNTIFLCDLCVLSEAGGEKIIEIT